VSKPTLESLLFVRDLIIDPIHEQAVQPASIDLCLGDEIGTYSSLGELDSRREAPKLDIQKIHDHGYLLAS